MDSGIPVVPVSLSFAYVTPSLEGFECDGQPLRSGTHPVP